jgi:hypothetical protein
LEITLSPFSFDLFENDIAAISFNSKNYLYYEGYKKDQNVPDFARVPDNETDLTEAERRIYHLKKSMGQGLSSDEFNGKTDSKPRGGSIRIYCRCL